jgi:hypothetical protein
MKRLARRTLLGLRPRQATSEFSLERFYAERARNRPDFPGDIRARTAAPCAATSVGVPELAERKVKP